MEANELIEDGHGTAERFAGLPDGYASLEDSRIVVLSIPFECSTSFQKGTENGPAAIIEASRNLELYDIETDSEVYKQGIHTAEPIKQGSQELVFRNIEERTKEYLEAGKFVAALGGEHSVSYPLIKAHAETFPGMSVLQIDAHSDLRDSYEGNPLSHACVMARVQDLKDVDKIVSVGVRSMCVEEKERLSHTKAFFAHDLDPDLRWVDDVVEALDDNVYITFDTDAFDSSIMPSTGTPEPGGIDWRAASNLLKAVAKKKNIVGFDVVELLPLPDLKAPDFLVAKLVYTLLSYKFSAAQKV
ncbi:MAG: agmatinase [Chlamydiales bacterium]|jgi:agmatinase